jgi:D-sedoheptulose 7-phosphate isomerase
MISHQVTRLVVALQDFDREAPRLQMWGSTAASVLTSGGRLLACASEPGSREHALRLAAELGNPAGRDRPALAARAIVPAESGCPSPETLAGQVRAIGRAGDILMCLSAADPAAEVLSAAHAAVELGLTTWALTGPAPDSLAAAVSDAISVQSPDARVVEEIHLVAIHILCAAADSCVRDVTRAGPDVVTAAEL